MLKEIDNFLIKVNQGPVCDSTADTDVGEDPFYYELEASLVDPIYELLNGVKSH